MNAQVEGYAEHYDPNSMLFMDFRRHHSGLWPDTASRCMLGENLSGLACDAAYLCNLLCADTLRYFASPEQPLTCWACVAQAGTW